MLTVVLICALLPAVAFAAEYRCPRPDGATQIIQKNRFVNLQGIDLYDGHPDEMAQLKPDNGDDMKPSEPAIWTAGDISPRAYWMVCTYEQGIRYLRRLGVVEKRCVEMMAGTLPLGLDCR